MTEEMKTERKAEAAGIADKEMLKELGIDLEE